MLAITADHHGRSLPPSITSIVIVIVVHFRIIHRQDFDPLHESMPLADRFYILSIHQSEMHDSTICRIHRGEKLLPTGFHRGLCCIVGHVFKSFFMTRAESLTIRVTWNGLVDQASHHSGQNVLNCLENPSIVLKQDFAVFSFEIQLHDLAALERVFNVEIHDVQHLLKGELIGRKIPFHLILDFGFVPVDSQPLEFIDLHGPPLIPPGVLPTPTSRRASTPLIAIRARAFLAVAVIVTTLVAATLRSLISTALISAALITAASTTAAFAATVPTILVTTILISPTVSSSVIPSSISTVSAIFVVLVVFISIVFVPAVFLLAVFISVFFTSIERMTMVLTSATTSTAVISIFRPSPTRSFSPTRLRVVILIGFIFIDIIGIDIFFCLLWLFGAFLPRLATSASRSPLILRRRRRLGFRLLGRDLLICESRSIWIDDDHDSFAHIQESVFLLPELVRQLLRFHFVMPSSGHHSLLYRIAGKKLSLHNGLRNAFDSKISD